MNRFTGAAARAPLTPSSTRLSDTRRQAARVLAFPARHRTFPLTVPIGAGESLDSWVEACANRYEISTTSVCDALGLRHDHGYISTMRRLPEPALRRAAGLAGLPESALVEAAGLALPSGAWLRGCRSRFCPACLAETGGRWQLAWRTVPIVVCRDHVLLLQDRCPGCGAFPRVRTRAAPSPMHCTARTDDAIACGADLSLAPRLAAPVSQAGEHQWAAALVAAAAVDGAAAGLLGELEMVMAWVEHRRHPGAASSAPEGRYRSAMVTSDLLPTAARVLGVDDDTAIGAIKGLLEPGARAPLTLIGVSSAPFEDPGSLFRVRYLRAIDATLAVHDRLRHRTTTPRPGLGRSPTARADGIPELLWPDWYARLLPPSGVLGDCARAAYVAALLLPGQRARSTQQALDQLAPHRARGVLASALGVHGPTGQTAVVQLLTRLADYLDATGAPIDYRRRRDLLTRGDLLPWSTWTTMAVAARVHPGDRPGSTRRQSPRVVHAQRYLQVLLVGADLSNPAHPLAWRTPSDRTRYHQFADTLSPTLRAGLRGHAEQVLDTAGIDEPLVWSPPCHLAEGLVLPGLDPGALDPDVVSAVVRGEITPTVAALRLGVHVDHIRLAIHAFDLPVPAALSETALARLRTPERAARIATQEFFEQHYLTEGRSLRELSVMTGVPKRVLSARAADLGIPVRSARAPRPVDPAWLREQYLERVQSTSEIGQALGCTEMTVAGALRRHGIPVRAPGVHARREMHAPVSHDHAQIVRAAVESTLHGWLRLSRFQAAMAYPCMKAAALELGLHPAALTREVQRLERDIGELLYVRATFGRPQRATSRGQELINALKHPATAAALRAAVGPSPTPPTDAQHRQLLAAHATRRPARPPAAYPGIAVVPLQRTSALLTVVQYLLDHADEDVWGYPISAQTGLDTGTLYPLLHRLHTARWTSMRVETRSELAARAPHARGEGRPRHLHRLTPAGQRAAAHVLIPLTTGPIESAAHPVSAVGPDDRATVCRRGDGP